MRGDPASNESLTEAAPRYLRELVAAEISSLTRYVDRVVQWQPLEHDSGRLLEAVECAEKSVATETLSKAAKKQTRVVLLNGNLNHSLDIQGLLAELKPRLARRDRVVVVLYNPYLRGLHAWANRLGIRRGKQPTTFVTRTDLRNLAALAGFEMVRYRPIGYVPLPLAGGGTLLNQVAPLLPGLRHTAITAVVTLRPIVAERIRPSLSVIIPARNERGNIAAALERLEGIIDAEVEVIFVEGHSTDGTWEEIQRATDAYDGPLEVHAFQQSGAGKADAVRTGMRHVTKELVTILDADLTMPPELLGRYYEAYRRGQADFINGSRLVYPMEGEAMRRLNHLGNTFFAKTLSALLDARLSDTLCGTKLMRRDDYARFEEWRRDFGDFDPFGDFELLFPAAVLGLGIMNLPVRYRDRTYGSTNIHRFRDGARLLRMVGHALTRLAVAPRR